MKSSIIYELKDFDDIIQRFFKLFSRVDNTIRLHKRRSRSIETWFEKVASETPEGRSRETSENLSWLTTHTHSVHFALLKLSSCFLIRIDKGT
ncbi:hypothetical protein L1887_35552 [Cichorium endivia]|nr:hypothetical protein L1887_35552 [Cichorium endivia]